MHSTPLMEKTFWEYHQAFDHRMIAWQKEVLFTWEWWLGVSLTMLPWILWIILKKNGNASRLLYSGVFVSLVSVTLDGIGVQVGAWNYLEPVTPVIPSYLPYDFALMPVSVMILIQFFTNKNSWIVGLAFGLLTAFIGEPIFKWLQIYEPVHWKHMYSVPVYMVIYVLANRLAIKRF